MGKGRILLIDDDMTFVALMTSVLKTEGYEIMVANNGTVGLQTVLAERPDLVILDVLMPEMTGYDFFQQLKKVGGSSLEIPILVVSGRESMKDFFKSWEITDFLPKPFEPKQLLLKVEEALKRFADKRRAREAEELSRLGGGKKVLIVGFDDFFLTNVRTAFEKWGYRVLTAHRENEGFKTAVTIRPYLIVSQFHKDGGIMNAGLLFEYLQKNDDLKPVPFLVFCPHDMEAQAERVFPKSQLVCYVTLNELATKISRWVEKHEVKSPSS